MPENTIKVLIIEDAKIDALFLDKALQEPAEISYTTRHVKTLEQALSALDSEHFDIALLDRSLPDADGFDGLHSIQNLAPKLPIIFLTGYQDEQTALNSIKQGAQDYIIKGEYDGAKVRRAIHYAISRKEFEAELIERAHYDVLTGLANRSLYESRLSVALSRLKRQSGTLAIFFLDLDGFKKVNDTLGHLAGDKLLAEIGQRLKLSVRPYDVAARFGGDEFALLIENSESKDYCAAVAEKIIKICGEPISISGQSVSVGVSIGIAEYRPDDDISMEELVHRADEAMYVAKAKSGSAFYFYQGKA